MADTHHAQGPGKSVLGIGQRIVSIMVEMVETRLRLAVVELEEEKANLFQLLLMLGLTMLFAAFGLMSLMVLIIWAVDPQYRLNAMIATTVVLLLSTQPGVSYSEHNLSKDKSLTRMQLWLDACPQRENPLIQKLALNMSKQQLIASPEGGMGSLQLRQQVWLHHIVLDKGESANFQLHGPRAYLQSIHGKFHALTHHEEKAALTCGDGAFIRDEANITLVADSPLRALLIDLPV